MGLGYYDHAGDPERVEFMESDFDHCGLCLFRRGYEGVPNLIQVLEDAGLAVP
jgi:hypothetical protein